MIQIKLYIAIVITEVLCISKLIVLWLFCLVEYLTMDLKIG